MKMDLQLFSEDVEVQDTQPESVEENDAQQKEDTFTQDDVNDIVSKRLARERAKYEAELRAKILEEQKNAQELATMTAEEKSEKLAQELEEAKEQIRLNKLEQDTVARLDEEGISIAFKEFLMGDDAETTNDNIKVFKEVFDKAVEKTVEERLVSPKQSKGTSIPKTKSNGLDTITRLANEVNIRK